MSKDFLLTFISLNKILDALRYIFENWVQCPLRGSSQRTKALGQRLQPGGLQTDLYKATRGTLTASKAGSKLGNYSNK